MAFADHASLVAQKKAARVLCDYHVYNPIWEPKLVQNCLVCLSQIVSKIM